MNMITLRQILIVLFVAAAVSVATGQSADTANPSPSQTLTGDVTVLSPKSGTAMKDASHVVEWLVPQEKIEPVQYSAAKAKYRIVQHDKMFQPNFLVVPIGSVVDFPNLDPWFHNVFSLYRGKKFDLGLYEAGSNKQVRFDRPGPSYVFCNIHPEMAAVVLTVDSPFFGVSDKSGRLVISNVPPGSYVLKVWYENATPETLNALTRPLVVTSDSRALPAITVAMTKQDLMKHKNKYGRDYDSTPASPVY